MAKRRKQLRQEVLGFSGETENPAASSAILSCRRVTRSFGALVAVNKLSFDVQPGTVFGIGGPNGAGKTTMFDVISGVQPADRGDVIFDGQSITKLKPHQICHAGIARTFQLNAAFETMSVWENVLIGSHHGHQPHEIPKLSFMRRERHSAEEVLEMVGLIDRRDAIVSSLTLMEQKLLMMASALATRPKLLLLDEPVGGLIPREIDQVEKIVENLTAVQGMTVVLIEHVMRFLTALSDEVLIMNYGEKLYQGPPDALADDQQVVDVYLGEGASAQFARKGKKSAHSVTPTDPSETASDEFDSDWLRQVHAASRQLVRQYRSGRIYPIDYLKLAQLLEQSNEDEKSTRVSRAARSLLDAREKDGELSQHFEMLERMIQEYQSNPHQRNDHDTKSDVAAASMRATKIESAARRVLEAQQNPQQSDDRLQELRAALMWEVANNSDPKQFSTGTTNVS